MITAVTSCYCSNELLLLNDINCWNFLMVTQCFVCTMGNIQTHFRRYSVMLMWEIQICEMLLHHSWEPHGWPTYINYN